MSSSRQLVPLAMLVLLVASGCSGDGSSSPTTTSLMRAADRTSTTVAGETAPVPSDPSRGCGTEPDVERVDPDRSPGDVAQTFTSGGVERAYRIAVPESYEPDEAAPLVFNLHGSGSNALQQSAYTDAARAGAKRGTLVVAPEATGGQWQLASDGTDSDFLVALLDDLESRYCVDRNRVHMMGLSLGAWKTAVTACAVPGRWVSIALITVEVFPGACEPMAIVAFHGTADPVVPYGEGSDPGVEPSGPNAGLPGAVSNIERWADSGGCDPEPTTKTFGDDITLRRFEGCDPGIGVELYTVKGGGHTWPGSDVPRGGPTATTQTIDATQIAFDWFEAHPRRTTD